MRSSWSASYPSHQKRNSQSTRKLNNEQKNQKYLQNIFRRNAHKIVSFDSSIDWILYKQFVRLLTDRPYSHHLSIQTFSVVDKTWNPAYHEEMVPFSFHASLILLPPLVWLIFMPFQSWSICHLDSNLATVVFSSDSRDCNYQSPNIKIKLISLISDKDYIWPI